MRNFTPLPFEEVARNPSGLLARLAIQGKPLQVEVRADEILLLKSLDHFKAVHRRLFEPVEGEGVEELGGDGDLMVVFALGDGVLVVTVTEEETEEGTHHITLERNGWYENRSAWIQTLCDQWAELEEGNRVLTLTTLDEEAMESMSGEDRALAAYVKDQVFGHVADTLWTRAHRGERKLSGMESAHLSRMRERELQDYLPDRREDLSRDDIDIDQAAVWTSPVIDPSGGVELFQFDQSSMDLSLAPDTVVVVGDCFGEVPKVHLWIPPRRDAESWFAAIVEKLGVSQSAENES